MLKHHTHADLVVVAAMPSELAATTILFETIDIVETEGGTWRLLVSPKGKIIWTATCGIRAKHITPLLQALTRQVDNKQLFLVGCCGALTPELEPGEAIIASHVVETPSGAIHSVSNHGSQKLQQIAPDARFGKVLTAEHVVQNAEDKLKLGRQFDCLAVEMEAAIVLKQTQKLGLNMSMIRWTLDRMNEDIEAQAESRAPMAAKKQSDQAIAFSELKQRLVGLSEKTHEVIEALLI